MISVFVIAGARLYREGLARFLDEYPEIAVVGSAADWPSASALVATLEPTIVLLDVATSGSMEAIGPIASAGRKVIALCIDDVENDVIACAEAGVSGFVTSDESLDDLVAAIESVARDEVLCSPRMTAALLRRVSALATEAHPREEVKLTQRELEIVELIDEGLTNKAIAQRLSIGVSTVKSHVHNILEKLHVQRRSEAARQVRASSRIYRGRLSGRSGI